MNNARGSTRVSLGAAGLWASAFVLAAMVLVQAGRLANVWGAAPAHADVVSRVGDFTTLTFTSGSDDVLAVLDGRGEQLLAYRIQNQNKLELLGVYDVKELFALGKRVGSGRR